MPDQPFTAPPENLTHVTDDDLGIGIRQSFSLVPAETSPRPVAPSLVFDQVTEPLLRNFDFCNQCWLLLHDSAQTLHLLIQELSESLYSPVVSGGDQVGVPLKVVSPRLRAYAPAPYIQSLVAVPT
jgi:hypothetical protein